MALPHWHSKAMVNNEQPVFPMGIKYWLFIVYYNKEGIWFLWIS